MRRGTLAKTEIYLGLLLFAVVIGLAGYGLVSTFADRLDPKVRDCIARNVKPRDGEAMSRKEATALCKRLEADGAL